MTEFRSESCEQKQRELIALFADCTSQEAKYQRIMELGQKTPKLDPSFCQAENLVQGCQSTMHLRTTLSEGKLYFQAHSDALISYGLAILLIKIYEGETPEAVLKLPPACLEQIGIAHALTPNRANGLFSIHLKMKRDALKWLVNAAA